MVPLPMRRASPDDTIRFPISVSIASIIWLLITRVAISLAVELPVQENPSESGVGFGNRYAGGCWYGVWSLAKLTVVIHERFAEFCCLIQSTAALTVVSDT